MQLIPLNRESVVLERPLPAAVYDETGILLLRKGYVFHSPDLLEAFAARPLHQRREEDMPAPALDALVPAGPANPFAWIARAVRLLARLLRPPHHARLARDIPRIGLLLQAACSVDADAAIAAILLVRSSSYHTKHAVDTALMCEIVARAMGVSLPDRLSILSAALTMNIGMARVQDQLDGQLSSLTAEQTLLVRQHPAEGHRLLQQAGVTDPIWLEAVLYHHELPDGSGYPHGLTRSAMGFGSTLVGTLDVYCALIADSGHRARQLPNQVMREMFTRRGTRYGEETPAWLVKEVGLHPPGTLVRLVSGETAVVIRKGSSLHHPWVMVFRDARGDLLPAPEPRDTAAAASAIEAVALAREGELRWDTDGLWALWQALPRDEAASPAAGQVHG